MKDNKRYIYRGEIYYARLYGSVGSEQKGTRPVVIIQNNVGNTHSTTVIIVPLTKKLDNIRPPPTHIDVKKVGNLKYESTILAEQIRTIDKERLGRKIGKLPYKIMEELERAIKIAEGIENK